MGRWKRGGLYYYHHYHQSYFVSHSSFKNSALRCYLRGGGQKFFNFSYKGRKTFVALEN